MLHLDLLGFVSYQVLYLSKDLVQAYHCCLFINWPLNLIVSSGTGSVPDFVIVRNDGQWVNRSNDADTIFCLVSGR